MCVCFGRVSLHCFNSCTPGIIYGPISSRCMGVASRWNYNGECMIKIFLGGGGRNPLPYEQLSPFPAPCSKMFLERSLNDPHPTTLLQASFTATLLPIHHPFSPHKNVYHTLRCSAFHGVYNMSEGSVMFLYPSRNDGGPRRNSTLYTRVIRVPCARFNFFFWEGVVRVGGQGWG